MYPELTLHERRNSKSNRNPCPAPTGLGLTGQITTFLIIHVFKKTTYRWKQFAKTRRRRLHKMCTVYCYYCEPCSLTGYSLSGYSAFKAFWLPSCMSKITPGTWKCPQRRKKTHLLQSWLPWFSKHYSLWSLGKNSTLSWGPCFLSGFALEHAGGLG